MSENEMKFDEYIKLAMRTNSDTVGTHGRQSIDLMHGAALVVTELYELSHAEDDINALEELGDVFWGIALCCHAVGHAPDDSDWHYVHEVDAAIELLDCAKKLFAYGNPEKKELLIRRVKILIDNIVSLISDSYGRDRCIAAMDANIKKLKSRYPDGFSQDDAYNRDKGAEYRAMGE